MIYTFLTSIVFIAEIIIAIALIQVLLRLDKAVLEMNDTVNLANPGIKDISELVKKISEQAVEFSKRFKEKVTKNSEEIVLMRLFRLAITFLLVKTNIKIVQKFRKSKITKALVKGLSLLEIMV